MPGNLLFTNTQLPNVNGNDTAKDMKNILNYLYMLREELRYTMSNIGVENFNTTELNNVLSSIDDGTIAEIQTQADNQGASINLLAAYTGLAVVETVTELPETPDATKTYKIGTDYYRWNGTEWIDDINVSSAALTLAAINGQSAASLKADRIDFTGFTTFLTADDLGEGGTTTIYGGRLDTDTVATLALKKRAGTGGLSGTQWLDFYAGIDMTAINEKDTSYYPDTRQLIGLKSLRLHRDISLTDGHGDASNVLYEIGSLQIGASSVKSLAQTWTSGGIDLFLSDTTNIKALQIASSGAVVINSGMANGQWGQIEMSAYNNTTKTSGYLMRVTGTGIAMYKYVSGTPTLLESWS